jgi:hypothetical protein
MLAGGWLACSPSALAGNWLPHSPDATWTYSWTDSVYAKTPTLEKVTVKEDAGLTFTLEWTTEGLDNPKDSIPSQGTMVFQDTNAGLVSTDWSSTPPPPSFPILCSAPARCPNALTGSLYNLIWGSRAPVLAEPLLKGFTWTSAGGGALDVTSSSTYLGTEPITVPAFPMPVTASKVQTEVNQAGAIGDPYGSGIRTVWWVYGVGPVRIEFDHTGGQNAPVTVSELQSTNLQPLPPPGDTQFFPLTKGTVFKYRWTNPAYLPQPEIEQFTVDAVVNNSARFTVKDLSGPIKVVGSYGFAARLDGVTSLWATVKAATKVKFPALGPANAPASKRLHFFTPFDLLTFGYNPILSAYPASGDAWAAAKPSRDFTVFGVTGDTKILGIQSVTVPAGTFDALAVQSTLSQAGFKFGSGTRTEWFAPDKGLVKLVFVHTNGTTSTVELLK